MLVVNLELRPCMVNGCKKALFHTWEQHSEIIPPSPMVGGDNGGVCSFLMGIVELEDGQVIKVHPNTIRFLDNKIREYVFNNTGSSTDGRCE